VTAAEPAGATAEDRAWTDVLRQIIGLSMVERDLRTTLRRVGELVAAVTSADACFVHVVDHDLDERVLMGATPEEFDRLAGTIRLRVGEGLAGWTAAHAEPALVDDKWTDPRYVYIPELRGEEYSSLVSVPLLRPEGLVVGVLNLHSRQAGHFSPSDVERLQEVASLLAGIVENAVLYDRLAKREAELARFAADMVELQELDRRRVAADIHDGISQRLVSAAYHLDAARARAVEPESRREIESAEALVSDALAEAKHSITGLRPVVLDDLGLNPALRSLASSLGGDLEVETDLRECDVPPHVETALYRIAQEALQNVVKHARARRVRIVTREDAGGVRLEIADDGVGFDAGRDPDHLAYGLLIMDERAKLVGGQLEVRSQPGSGTTVIARVPAGAYGSAGSAP
jgi:two-component system, NarL family, sensor kinase